QGPPCEPSILFRIVPTCLYLSFFGADLDVRPSFVNFCHFGQIRVATKLSVRCRQHLANHASHEHRDTKCFRLIDAEADVLVGKTCGKAVIKTACEDCSGKLVCSCSVAAAASVDDL